MRCHLFESLQLVAKTLRFESVSVAPRPRERWDRTSAFLPCRGLCSEEPPSNWTSHSRGIQLYGPRAMWRAMNSAGPLAELVRFDLPGAHDQLKRCQSRLAFTDNNETLSLEPLAGRRGRLEPHWVRCSFRSTGFGGAPCGADPTLAHPS